MDSYIRKQTPISRMGQGGEVEQIIIYPGTPIGLLLSLTYAHQITITSKKNIQPISRIKSQ